MKNSLVKDLLAELSDLPMIEAVALGGSRAGENYDENSDYDIYLYCFYYGTKYSLLYN